MPDYDNGQKQNKYTASEKPNTRHLHNLFLDQITNGSINII